MLVNLMQENSAQKQAVHVLLSILLSIISRVSMIPMFCSCIVFTETVCCNIQTTNSTNFRSKSVTFTAKLLLRRRLRLHNHLPILEPQRRPLNPRTRSFRKTPPVALGFPNGCGVGKQTMHVFDVQDADAVPSTEWMG